ncbi:CD99 antigen-like protein 2 [Varanus komodoensis]|nr:CD99 antigen-like protein 2 [Varanus komodoensis]
MAEQPGRRGRRLALLLAVAVAVLSGRGYANDSDLALEDALDGGLPTKRPTHKPPKKTSGGTGELDLLDFFDTPPERTTKPAKATTGTYPRKPGKHLLLDFIARVTLVRPPCRPKAILDQEVHDTVPLAFPTASLSPPVSLPLWLLIFFSPRGSAVLSLTLVCLPLREKPVSRPSMRGPKELQALHVMRESSLDCSLCSHAVFSHCLA